MSAIACPSSNPIKPRCALEVAVVGNRRFAGETDAVSNVAAVEMKAHAAAACEAVWRILTAAMNNALQLPVKRLAEQLPPHASTPPLYLRDFFNAEQPRLGVMSCLAAGADQIGAKTALAFGKQSCVAEVELEVVLPFPEADYPGLPGARRSEFREEEAADLRDLAKRARQVICLDGRYLADTALAPDHPVNEASQHRSYQQGRDVLLQNTDLVVAIYDPRVTGKAAGTVETVGLALAASLPVVAILVAPNEARLALYKTPADRPSDGESEWQQAEPISGSAWSAALAERVTYLLSLPHLIPVLGETDKALEARLRSLSTTVSRLRLFYGDECPHSTCACPVRGKVFAWAWKGMRAMAERFAMPHSFSSEGPKPVHVSEEITVQPYAAFYDRASLLSGDYMRTYRGAFVLAFSLAAVAVVVAVALMVSALLTDGQPPLPLLLGLGGMKVGILAGLLWLEHTSRHELHQEHAADFRYLAELLRPMQWLAPLATCPPTVELPAHYAPLDPRQGWTHWLFRAIGRSTPSVAMVASKHADASPQRVTFDPTQAIAVLDRAGSEWLQGQVYYHWTNAQNMHAIEDGFGRLGKVLLYFVLACAAAALALEVLYHEGCLPWPIFFHPFAIVLGGLAAAVPAVIAALGGITSQSEAKRLRIRSEAMFHGLLSQQRALRPVPNAPPGGETWRAAQQLRSLAGMMIHESSDWKALYQLHEVKAG